MAHQASVISQAASPSTYRASALQQWHAAGGDVLERRAQGSKQELAFASDAREAFVAAQTAAALDVAQLALLRALRELNGSAEPAAGVEPPPAPGAAACPSSCVEACEGDIACLNACDGRDLSCFGCVLDESAGCGGLSCLASLAADRECFARCINSTVLIGGNVGLCFESECADSYAEASACLSTALAADECAAARTRVPQCHISRSISCPYKSNKVTE